MSETILGKFDVRLLHPIPLYTVKWHGNTEQSNWSVTCKSARPPYALYDSINPHPHIAFCTWILWCNELERTRRPFLYIRVYTYVFGGYSVKYENGDRAEQSAGLCITVQQRCERYNKARIHFDPSRVKCTLYARACIFIVHSRMQLIVYSPCTYTCEWSTRERDRRSVWSLSFNWEILDVYRFCLLWQNVFTRLFYTKGLLQLEFDDNFLFLPKFWHANRLKNIYISQV